MNRDALTSLEQIPNVGPSLAADLRRVGVQFPGDLPGKDAYALYDALCAATGERQDPCVLDVFLSAVRFMEGAPARAWWHYTKERKALAVPTQLRHRSATTSGRRVRMLRATD